MSGDKHGRPETPESARSGGQSAREQAVERDVPTGKVVNASGELVDDDRK